MIIQSVDNAVFTFPVRNNQDADAPLKAILPFLAEDDAVKLIRHEKNMSSREALKFLDALTAPQKAQ